MLQVIIGDIWVRLGLYISEPCAGLKLAGVGNKEQKYPASDKDYIGPIRSINNGDMVIRRDVQGEDKVKAEKKYAYIQGR